MYDMFCSSVHHLIRSLTDADGKENARLELARMLELLADPALYREEAGRETHRYLVLCDTLFHLSAHQARYPSTGAFLWTLESRGMTGQRYGIATQSQLDELARLIVMILKMQYWEDVG